MKDFSCEILELLDRYQDDTAAALAGEKNPRCLYAFSPLRENLFEWLELKKEDDVLQVGSDYGSYTGLIAERAGSVTVLDPKEEALEINRRRHGSRGNIRYICGDVLETAIDRSFDYVIITGMAEQYEKGQAPALFEAAIKALKPGGSFLFAAENEAGVRYWMGAERFEASFLEAEFRQLFAEPAKKYGGTFMIYYPVPDYRYPSVIYSDDYLPQAGDVTNISARLDGPGLWYGNEDHAMAMACKNGSFTKFANSFLGVYKKGQL